MWNDVRLRNLDVLTLSDIVTWRNGWQIAH